MNLSKMTDPRSWQKWQAAGAVSGTPLVNKHRFGLSLSLCIAAILRGEVKESDVERIISGTRCSTQEDWNKVIKTYQESYWHEHATEGERIARRFLSEGRITQPRLNGLNVQLAMPGRGISIWATSMKKVNEQLMH